MVEWESGMPLGSKLCMASRAFKHDVREILMSDLHKNLKETSLGTKDRSCVNGMFVIIMSVEICWSTDFVTRRYFMNLMVRGR